MKGYSDLASFMTSRQDTGILKRFSGLNMENLLHMQAELLSLELTINEMRQDSDMNGFHTSWIAAADSPSNALVGGVFERIRVLLDQYCAQIHRQYPEVTDRVADKAILQTVQLNALEHPQPASQRLLQKWYDEESGGGDFLRGIEAAVIRDSDCWADLMSLNGRPGKDDPIASFIADKLLPHYDRWIGHRLHRSMSAKAFADSREYEMKALVLLGNVICMILSAVLPAAAILVLFNVKSMVARLVTIIIMSLLFSLVMTMIAQKKADVFMSTTAFAAVLVVFVGSTNIMGT